MLPITFGTITGDEVCGLVTRETRESRRLDFKRELYKIGAGETSETRSREMRELVADVVAFANSEGGDIVIGVDEMDEVAVAAAGVDLTEATEFERKLANYWKDKVDPPLSSVVDSRVIQSPSDASKAFVLIRVRPSQNAPHLTSAERIFYERNGAQKNAMDMSRIREAFLREDIHYDAFDAFRRNRQRQVQDGVTSGLPFLQLHAAPLHALARSSRQLLNFENLNPRDTMPSITHVDREFFTATGFFCTSDADDDSGPLGYQVFFDGRYEQVIGGKKQNGDHILPLGWIMRGIAMALRHTRRVADQLGNGPILVGVTGTYLSDSILDPGNRQWVTRKSKVAPNEVVWCPEIRLEALPERSIDFAKLLAPTLLPLFLSYNRDKVELSLDEAAWSIIDRALPS